MFDSNALRELAHVKADHYQRAGGGGGFVVYNTAQAYYTARGFKELSPFRQACLEMLHRFRTAASISEEHFRMECLTNKGGFYEGDSIPF